MKKVSDNLRRAKKAKNDEFFTQYDDVKKEIDAYFSLNRDVFKDKIVLLSCDDQEQSAFVEYFINLCRKTPSFRGRRYKAQTA